MAYGDGVNWRGTADALSVTLHFSVQMGVAVQAVPFEVEGGQSALLTAIALMTTWNANWPGEASMPVVTEAVVRFTKEGQAVKLMQVKEDGGPWQDLPATVNGYEVTNVY